MSAAVVEDASRAFKKALIEKDKEGYVKGLQEVNGIRFFEDTKLYGTISS